MKTRTRTKHKHWFEIIAYAEGWEILRHYNKKEWNNTPGPLWFNKTIYVVNDALVEFRKAEKLGEQIQIQHIQDQWSDIELESWNPSDNYNVDNFRIKPSEPDFSILNEEDVFYIKTWEYSFLLRWDCNTKDEIKHFNCVNIEDTYCQYNRGFFQKSGVECLRKATPEETALFYKHFPELEPPKVGDWGWFWDNEKMQTRISKLCDIHSVGYTYEDMNTVSWKHFQKIDTSKTLDEIIKEFGL